MLHKRRWLWTSKSLFSTTKLLDVVVWWFEEIRAVSDWRSKREEDGSLHPPKVVKTALDRPPVANKSHIMLPLNFQLGSLPSLSHFKNWKPLIFPIIVFLFLVFFITVSRCHFFSTSFFVRLLLYSQLYLYFDRSLVRSLLLVIDVCRCKSKCLRNNFELHIRIVHKLCAPKFTSLHISVWASSWMSEDSGRNHTKNWIWHLNLGWNDRNRKTEPVA